MVDLDGLGQIARRAALSAAAVAMRWRSELTTLEIREKSGPRDLVSEADLEAEIAARNILVEERPLDAVIGEEKEVQSGTSGITWLLDPIDGTTSYLYGREDWAVSLAAIDGRGNPLVAVVIEPALSRVTEARRGKGAWESGKRLEVRTQASLRRSLIEVNFGSAEQQPKAGQMVSCLLPSVRDLRRGGSAAVSLTHLAAGRADAVWSPGLQPWDGAAGMLIANEAGATVGDLSGPVTDGWPGSGDILAAHGLLWSELRELLAAVYP